MTTRKVKRKTPPKKRTRKVAKKRTIIPALSKKEKVQRNHRAIKIISENIGNPKKIKKELMAMGYSESYIDSGQMKKTNSFQVLVDKYLPDEDLMHHHKEMLRQTRIDYFVFPRKMEDEEIFEHVEAAGLTCITVRTSDKGKMAFYAVADANAKKAALDMAYKLKSKYGDTTIVHKFGELSDAELEEALAREISEGAGD